MSDLTAAILILPVLLATVLILECSRAGCTRIAQRVRAEQARKGSEGASK